MGPVICLGFFIQTFHLNTMRTILIIVFNHHRNFNHRFLFIRIRTYETAEFKKLLRALSHCAIDLDSVNDNLSSPGNTSGTVPQVKPRQSELILVRANLTRVTSPPNSATDDSCLIFSVLFSYFLFICYLPRCILPDFPSVSSFPFLPCYHHSNKM